MIKREHLNAFLLAFFYGVGIYALMFVLHQRDMVRLLPDNEKLIFWDAGYYHEIMEKGYMYTEGQTGNTAFSMLFPLLWRMLGFSAMGIAFVNIFLFAIGAAILHSILPMSHSRRFLWLTTPSLYFCFIPYTEALFMLLGAVVFLGIDKQSRWLTWFGLFLLAMTRPVALTLLPAFLIMEVITSERSEFGKATARFFVNYGVPLAAGQFLFIWYEYYQTGVWFAFFKVEKHWGHEFSCPTLPFNSMYGPKLLWLNALAMFVAFIALLILVREGLLWLMKNKLAGDKKLILSYLYMVAMLMVTIFFMPIWGTYTTNVYDILRYVFCTPFFYVFFHHFIVQRKYSARDYVVMVLLTNTFWLLFASYNHIMYLVYFNFCTALVTFYMLSTEKRYEWVSMALCAINLFVQINMFQFFLEHIYHG